VWLLGGGFGSVGGCEAVLFLCVGKNVSPVGLLGGGDRGRRGKTTWVL
jgi:hypothetical protein